MQARMSHPAFVVPGAMEALQALGRVVRKAGGSSLPVDLVHLRASHNGCNVCVDMHSRDLKKAGDSDERLFAVAAWREAPYFTDAERAALALAEPVTLLSDRTDPVPDQIWAEAARHYDEQALAARIISIATVNAGNRLNASTRQVAGEWIS